MHFLETVICLIILRCDSYLRNSGTDNSLERFPALSELASRLDHNAVERWSFVTAGDEDRQERELSPEEQRYLHLLAMMDDDNVLQTLLDLSMAVFVCPEFDAYLNHYLGYSVNLQLAYILEGITFPDESDVYEKLLLAETICDVDRQSFPLRYQQLSIDERIFAYLSGNDAANPVLSDFTEIYRYGDKGGLHEAFINEDQIRKGVEFFKKGGKVLHISGRGGRRFIARHIASGLKKDFIFLNIEDLFSGDNKKILKELRGALIREAELASAGICIYGISDRFLYGTGSAPGRHTARDLEVLERLLFTPVSDRDIPLILISDRPELLIRTLSEKEYRITELPERPEFSSRLKLWRGFKELYGLKQDPAELAVRYHMNASECAVVIRSFLERREQDGSGEDELLARISMERLGDGKTREIGRIVYPTVLLGDVKIKPEIMEVLNDVVNSVRSSAVILDDWGLRESYPYGRCVSLLLSGPPGTGKTMTANAIAGELGLPLYQVNLSNIVDKYIGETEKNLEEAFSYAEKTNTVLFFDEADSLFGTRSEVHDSKDKYANTEISYLLQRIEAYDGIVIMATNIKGNIDPAFLRRIRYVANFENPDEDLRREIWKSCIKDSLPHGEIDVDYLAVQFDKFTGSVIKTVFLNACAYAAGKGEELNMKHLIHAVRHELEKTTSVTFTMDTLGKYAYLI